MKIDKAMEGQDFFRKYKVVGEKSFLMK
jgi:hypothetical protein